MIQYYSLYKYRDISVSVHLDNVSTVSKFPNCTLLQATDVGNIVTAAVEMVLCIYICFFPWYNLLQTNNYIWNNSKAFLLSFVQMIDGNFSQLFL